jgi:hypothetical protein
MNHLPAGYLKKPGQQYRAVRLLDIAVLLYGITRAAADEQIGFEDAQATMDQIIGQLCKKKVLVDPRVLESALWSCNLLDEKGAFWHPKDQTFEAFVKDLLGSDRFNRIYNVIEKQGE